MQHYTMPEWVRNRILRRRPTLFASLNNLALFFADVMTVDEATDA